MKNVKLGLVALAIMAFTGIANAGGVGYIDYAKLAIAIINEFESDREESGRREIERGMKYLLNKYTAKNERKIIDDVLMTLTGWNLKTLLEESREIDDTEV